MSDERTAEDPTIEVYGQKLTLTHFSGITEDGLRITVQPTDDPLRFTTDPEVPSWPPVLSTEGAET